MKKLNYGIDAPGVIRNLLGIGIVLLLVAFLLPVVWTNIFTLLVANTVLWPGICLIITGLFMLLYGKWGKFQHREKILSCHDWKGDEKVLDVGCGAGLLLIGAAKRLGTGRANGIDIFKASDLSNNNLRQLTTNATLEKVVDRIRFTEQDIQQTNFENDYFDVILSNLCLHNIAGKQGRQEACAEITRVLRPGGKAIISDFLHTRTYKKHFQDSGMLVSRKGPYFWGIIPPLFIVIAEKPVKRS